jgi:hypothetical protein
VSDAAQKLGKDRRQMLPLVAAPKVGPFVHVEDERRSHDTRIIGRRRNGVGRVRKP